MLALLETANFAEYADLLLAQLRDLRLAIQAETLPLAEAISDQQTRARLLALYDSDFRDLGDLSQSLGSRLGVSSGFNADDGD